MIEGLFEIHITVDHTTGLFSLHDFVSKYKGMKLILAVAERGSHKDQYMISKWCNGTEKEVIKKANSIKDETVESMAHNKGVPTTAKNFYNYFEYHVKMEGKNNDYVLLEKVKSDLGNSDFKIGISYNLCGSKTALFTLRVFNHRGEEIKNLVLNHMKEKYGISFYDAIQQKFAVYDTNQELDIF